MTTTQLARTLDWGPANIDPENPFGRSATGAALEHRDAETGNERDDN